MRHPRRRALPGQVKQQMIEWFGPISTSTTAAQRASPADDRPEEWLAHPGSVGDRWLRCTCIGDDGGRAAGRRDR